MNLINRFRTWLANKREWRDWVAYRLTHPLTDWATENTAYDSYLRSATMDVTSRIYISRVLLHAFILWIFLTLASNLALIPWEWIQAIAGVAESVLATTNIALIITGFFQGIWESLVEIVSSSPDIDVESVGDSIEDTARGIGEEIVVLGAILYAILMAFETVVEPIILTVQEVVGEVDLDTGSGADEDALNDLLGQATDYIPPAETIRNIISFLLAPLAALMFAGVKLYWPIYVAGERGRKIGNGLARAYTFMYALSEGGLDIYEVMKEIADAEDAYGDISVTFQKIVRNANRGEESLAGAIVQVADETPNEELEDFLNGLVNSIDTGSDITRYLETRAELAFQEAKEEQENRLDLYEIISETYVILFVAAPIFFLILQLVQAMTGSVDRGATQFVPYALIPVGGFMISAIVYLTSDQTSQQFRELTMPTESKWYDIEEYTDTKPEFETFSYKISEQLKGIRKQIIRPFRQLRYHPKYTILITLPISILIIVLAIQAGLIPTSGIDTHEVDEIDGVDEEMTLGERLDERFLEVTIILYYVPFMLITVPWMLLYEAKRRRRAKTFRQLPQLFSAIAESNKRGLTLQESLETTAMSNDSELYNNLQRAIRKSKFTDSIESALIAFANDMRVPRLSQSIRLLVKANTVSSNVTVVVEAIAEDLKAGYALKRDRSQRARIYVVIMFVSFLISSGVLIALDATFFEFITDEAAGDEDVEDDLDDAGAGYGGDLPIEFFQRVFLHTLMSLALVSGLVAGIMENSDPQNGLKYAIAMTTLALIGFVTVPIII